MHPCATASDGRGLRARIRRVLILCGAAGLAAVSGLPAEACSIAPPPMPPALSALPDESESAYAARRTLHLDGFNALQRQRVQDAARERQTDVWARADKVVVIEVASVQTGVEIPNAPMGRGVRTSVKPVAWLKGGAKGRSGRTPFVLAHVSFTSCGPSPDWPVFSAKPGDRLLVFMGAGAPAQAATLDVFRPDDIVVGEVLAALAAKVR